MHGRAHGDRVYPRSFRAHIRPGRSKRFRARVDLVPRPAPRLPFDILLLFDATRSMEGTIGQVRDNAAQIMRELRARNPDSCFGVASFTDYHIDPPWRLDQDITADAEAVERAIAAIRLMDGEDFPEAYSRALYESRFVGWRPGARRYIVLFGDAPAHDPNFFGENTGVDPGRDGQPGTADDLRFRDVVRQLRDDGIVVVANYDPEDELASKGFEYLAAQTGGVAVPVFRASDVPAAILSGLEGATSPRPDLSAPARFAQWLQVATGDASGGGAPGAHYQVTLTVPAGTPAGRYAFPIAVRLSVGERSVHIGSIEVQISTTMGAHYLWRWLLLPLALLARALRGRSRLRPASRLHLRGGAWRPALLRLATLAMLASLLWLAWR
jgi:hypothetical protein